MLMLENRTNLKLLNDMNKTALYYASKNRQDRFGWQNDITNIMKYEHMMGGDTKTKADHAIERLQKKVTRDEIMQVIYEARRRKSKKASSLTLE